MIEDDFREIRALMESTPMDPNQREVLLALLSAAMGCECNPFAASDIIWALFELTGAWGLNDVHEALWRVLTGERDVRLL